MHIAVLDIGKTNAKLIIVDGTNFSEVEVKSTPNKIIDGIYPHHDVAALWQFFKNSLQEFSKTYEIEAITISAHGASIILLYEKGDLAFPMLDYEHGGIEEFNDRYDQIRPSFEETGSPKLSGGLNVGAQLYWLSNKYPNEFSNIKTIVTYPQYWAYLFSGIKTCDITSLGCHTDLWLPKVNELSPLVDRLNLRDKFSSIINPGENMGTILPELADELGLSKQVKIFSGIHDSNASLVPYLKSREGAFTVVSTGTWVVSLAMEGKLDGLKPERDTLINTNAFGQPVASSRFMGGREFEILMKGHETHYADTDIDFVLANNIFCFPSWEINSGPFQGQVGHWSCDETKLTDAQRMVVVSFYLAMMTATCIDLISKDGDVIVEGPFTQNQLILEMLAAILPINIYSAQQGGTGTAIGAAMLICRSNADKLETAQIERPTNNGNFHAYYRKWQELIRL